jgi:hypothetical protein
MDQTPQLTYFCELEPQPLQALFADPQVIPFLADTRASVGLGILDLSDERAGVVRALNQAGIPVTAWLLLPKDQGYWFNLDNAPQAAQRYDQFKAWSARNGLQWSRIGMDIEPDLRAIQLIFTDRLAGIRRLVGQAFARERLASGRRAYQELVRRVQADGNTVEAYHFPFLIDERIARSNVLQRLAGLVDLQEADHEVFMLYSSFMRPWGQGLLWSYAPQTEIIGVGSTGGGVELDAVANVSPLNWAELQTDLLLASQHASSIYIFSLEGCVRQDFIQRLREFDWQQPVLVPYKAAQRVENVRQTFRRGLWLLERPAWILFGLALIISLVTLYTRRKK